MNRSNEFEILNDAFESALKSLAALLPSDRIEKAKYMAQFEGRFHAATLFLVAETQRIEVHSPEQLEGLDNLRELLDIAPD